ncbi:ATP-binding protein [Parashewanella spongiae]|nr:response regulator [Parashewanella spongiae]MCL1076971.1 ATP-binding protein [Parashewanella spongiae]
MRKLSLVSKLTITLVSLFIAWWLLIEYQSYQQTIHQKIHKGLLDYQSMNQLQLDLVDQSLISAKKNLIAYNHILKKNSFQKTKEGQAAFGYYIPRIGSFPEKGLKKAESTIVTIPPLIHSNYPFVIVSSPTGDSWVYSKYKMQLAQLTQIVLLLKSNVSAELDKFVWSKSYKNFTNEVTSILSYKANRSKEALTISIPVTIYSSLLTRLQSHSKSQYALVTPRDHSLSFIANPDKLAPSQELVDLVLNNRHLPEQQLNKEVVINGMDYFFMSSFTENPNWQLLSIMPKSEIATSAKNAFIQKLSSSLFLLLALTILVVIIFKLHLEKPIKTYIKILQDDNTPNLERYLPHSPYEELDEIAQAYNRLLDEVKLSHQRLELQVAERTKELLAASQAAELANERKTEHLTSISHEIRTPLNGILGALELLLNNSLSAKQKSLIITASNCCHSLLSLINNLLDFSRIEAEQIQLKLAQYSSLALIDEAMASIESQAISKGLRLNVQVNTNVPEYINLDAQRVRQILTNLLGNSVKFTDKGHIFLQLSFSVQQLHYQVEDTGCGMNEQEQLTVFEPYVQGQHQKIGSGLGLPISQKLAQIMGGTLTVSSVKHQGSVFCLSIPITHAMDIINLQGQHISAPESLHAQLLLWKAIPVNSESQILQSSELTYMPARLLQFCREIQNNFPHFAHSNMPALLTWQLKVLVVDDVDVNREILSKMLHELGQKTYTAASAMDALDLATKHVFDLVLMDIRMPEVDGYQASKLWRQSNSILDANCPIFALTANAEPQAQAEIESCGMQHYITKPISLRSLNHALEIAADIQLERDMSLTINSDIDTPLIDIMQTDLTHKLYSQLTEMLLTLKKQIDTNDFEKTSHLLHTLKGTSGLAGLHDIVAEVTKLESIFVYDSELKLPQLKALNTLIQSIDDQSFES